MNALVRWDADFARDQQRRQEAAWLFIAELHGREFLAQCAAADKRAADRARLEAINPTMAHQVFGAAR